MSWQDDIIQVSDDVMGQVIGKGGCRIHKIRADTGADIECCKGKLSGFYITGTEQQCTLARRYIQDIVRKVTPEVLHYIPEEMKGHVIGAGGSTLRSVSEKTGARLSSKNGRITLAGDEEARERAHLYLKNELASWRWSSKARDGSNDVLYRTYIEDSVRGKEARVVFKQVSEKEKQHKLRSPTTQYKLAMTMVISHQTTRYEFSDSVKYLQEDISTALTCAKDDLLSRCAGELHPLAELWCHFGRVHFGRLSEEDEDRLWKLSELEEVFSRTRKVPGERPKWRQLFKEGVSADVETLKRLLDPHHGRSAREVTRWDLNFMSPSAERIRCKLWLLEGLARDDVNSKGLDETAMQHDLNYAVSELAFTEHSTRDRACGWLCRSPRPRLKTNIIAPEVGIDCRLTISTVDTAISEELLNTEEDYEILGRYLSGILLSPNGGVILPGPLPEGFQLQYKRRSRRTHFTHSYKGLEFSLAVCKETFLELNGAGPITGDVVDVYISCTDWEKLLVSGEFETREIVKRFPTFWQFVQRIRGVLSQSVVVEEEEKEMYYEEDEDEEEQNE